VAEPGQYDAGQEGKCRFVPDGRERFMEKARLAQGGGGADDQPERQQHQPEADEDAAEIMRPEL
jgi:hypothetical protein